MRFSDNSDITLVVTSCGRLDLLKATLDSFDRCNTAPIREVFITEDSGDDAVHGAVPESWKAHCRVFVNRPKLGQLASIDLAYSHVKTPYIFHCEDDWAFYRQHFVEDSRLILESSPHILQVWLRSHAHDLSVHSPYISIGERQVIANVPCYPLLSDKPEWQAFSLNPGLPRLSGSCTSRRLLGANSPVTALHSARSGSGLPQGRYGIAHRIRQPRHVARGGQMQGSQASARARQACGRTRHSDIGRDGNRLSCSLNDLIRW